MNDDNTNDNLFLMVEHTPVHSNYGRLDELKTPLAVIEANADVLQDKVGESKWIGYIQNEIESMNKLINELLLLAKIENIDNIKEYTELNLSKEVEIILSMFESIAQGLSSNDIYKQIGNAVPVNLAKCVGESIMTALNEGGI